MTGGNRISFFSRAFVLSGRATNNTIGFDSLRFFPLMIILDFACLMINEWEYQTMKSVEVYTRIENLQFADSFSFSSLVLSKFLTFFLYILSSFSPKCFDWKKERGEQKRESERRIHTADYLWRRLCVVWSFKNDFTSSKERKKQITGETERLCGRKKKILHY